MASLAPLDERFEAVVHKDDASDGARGGRAGGHGHGDIGGAQGTNVVGAVTDHGNEVLALSQGDDQLGLLLWRDAPEHAVAFRRVFELSGSELFEFVAGNEAALGANVELSKERGHGAGVVARNDLRFDAEAVHHLEGGGDFGTEDVAKRDETEGPQAGHGLADLRQFDGFGEHNSAQPLFRSFAVPGGDGLGIGAHGQHGLWSAENEDAFFVAGVQFERAPAAFGIEGNGAFRGGAVGVRAERFGECARGLAVGGCGGNEGGEPGKVAFVAFHPADSVERELVGGEGAGLVEADDVGVVEGFDGGDVLHDGAAAGNAHRADGKGDGHAEEQANGNDRGDERGDVADGIADAAVVDHVLDEEHDGEGGGGRKNDAQDAVETLLERRGALHDLAGVGGEFDCIGFHAHSLGFEIAVTGGAVAARLELVAGGLLDGVFLPGQERFVDFAGALGNGAVGHHLVALLEVDEVAFDDFFGEHLDFAAVADDGGVGSGERHEFAQGAGGAQ